MQPQCHLNFLSPGTAEFRAAFSEFHTTAAFHVYTIICQSQQQQLLFSRRKFQIRIYISSRSFGNISSFTVRFLLSLLSYSVGMWLLVCAAVLHQEVCLYRMCMYMPAILYILYVSVCQHTSLFTRGCVDLPKGEAVCLVFNRSQPICAKGV